MSPGYFYISFLIKKAFKIMEIMEIGKLGLLFFFFLQVASLTIQRCDAHQGAGGLGAGELATSHH